MKFGVQRMSAAVASPSTELAQFHQLVEDNKSLIVIVHRPSGSNSEVTISMIQRCKQLQIAVFLVHAMKISGRWQKIHAILSVNKDTLTKRCGQNAR
jgi:hypothetical protein